MVGVVVVEFVLDGVEEDGLFVDGQDGVGGYGYPVVYFSAFV